MKEGNSHANKDASESRSNQSFHPSGNTPKLRIGRRPTRDGATGTMKRHDTGEDNKGGGGCGDTGENNKGGGYW